MTKNALWLKIDGDGLRQALQDAAGKLDGDGGEAVLDFSSVQRIDAKSLGALQDLAGVAEAKRIHIVLHGVNVNVYKVLKLIKLEQSFAFLD